MLNLPVNIMKKLTIQSFFTVLLLCMGFWAKAYTFTIEGYLLYKGIPFEGGTVIFYTDPSSEEVKEISDAKGFYSHTFDIPDGTVQTIQLQTQDLCSGVGQVQLLASYEGVMTINLELCAEIIFNECQASFYYMQTNPLTYNISFQDASFIQADSWLWDFGDGTTSTEQNPTHQYPGEGLYDVNLTITSGDSCTSSMKQPVYVWVDSTLGQCFVKFWGYQDNPDDYFHYAFFGDAYGIAPVTTYSWDFGDGTTSTEQNPAHTYAQAGEYIVTFTITTEDGCSSGFSQPFKVYNLWGNCSANFSYSADSLAFQFTDLSLGNITSWHWSFGDGSTSNEQNPAYEYSYPGYYFVELTIYTADNCSNYYNNYICVGDCGWIGWEKCYASFYSQPTPEDSLTWSFIDQSYTLSGQVEKWFWDFGDGNTGEGPSPVHSYTSAGIYNVTLSINSSDGCLSTVANSVRVGVEPCVCPAIYAPVCVTLPDGSVTMFENSCWATCQGYSDFYYCEGLACGASFWSSPLDPAGLAVQFKDASWGNVTSWFWDFGDGSFASEPAPVHTYAEPGVYVVSLTIQTADSCINSIKYEVYVGEKNFQGSCQAFFWFDTNADDPLTFKFVNESFGDFMAITWDFGDGQSSNEANPVHTYEVAGNYFVTLTGIAADGCTSSYSMNLLSTPGIYYNSECQALFVPVINGLNVGFYSNSWGTVKELSWDFGDGTTSNEAVVSKNYSQQGIYKVILTITTESGCSSQFATWVNLMDGNFMGDASTAAIVINDAEERKLLLQGVSLLPNPAGDQVRLNFSQPVNGEMLVSILNPGGQELRRDKIFATGGQQHVELHLNGLNAGFYFVRVSTGKESSTLKLVKM